MKLFIGFIFVVIFYSFSPTSIIRAEEQGYALNIEFDSDTDWFIVSIKVDGEIHFIENEIHHGDKSDVKIFNDKTQIMVQVMKTPYDQSRTQLTLNILFTSNHPELELRLEKGFIGETHIAFYGFTGNKFQCLNQFTHANVESNPVKNPFFYILENNKIQECSFPIEYNSKTPKRQVFAIYYPWYGIPNESSNDYEHWAPISSFDSDHSANFPLIGLYDSLDERVLETHKKMAISADIDGFLCSWGGIGTREDNAFRKYLEVISEDNFSLGVYYESLRGKSEPLMKNTQIIDELVYLIENYGNHSSYLVFDDKPVIFIYQAETQLRSPSFWGEILESVEAIAGPCVFIGEFRDPAYLDIFDGIHIYNELNILTHKNQMKKHAIFRRTLSKTSWIGILFDLIGTRKIFFQRKIGVGMVTPGYDDRETRTPSNYVPRNNLTTYETYWSNLNELTLDWVTITSFNEWHEGTEIEPTFEYGSQYLNETRIHSLHFKQSQNIQSDDDVFEYPQVPSLMRVKLYE